MAVAGLVGIGFASSVCLVASGQAPASVGNPPTKPEVVANPSATSLRLYVGQVISSTEAGAIIDCKAPASAGQLKGTINASPSGRFFLRGTPELLAPSAEVQFLATDDGTYRYIDFFKTVSTMPAVRFVKWEKPAVAVVPTPQPVAAQPAPTPKPRSTNPTPNLKGTSLDRPPERLRRQRGLE